TCSNSSPTIASSDHSRCTSGHATAPSRPSHSARRFLTPSPAGRGGQVCSGPGRQGHGCLPTGTLLTPLVLCRNFAVYQMQAVCVVFADNDAGAGNGVSRTRHGAIAHAKFFQRQWRGEPIGHQLRQPASSKQAVYNDPLFEAGLDRKMVIVVDLIV